MESRGDFRKQVIALQDASAAKIPGVGLEVDKKPNCVSRIHA